MKIEINTNIIISATPEKTIFESAKLSNITINHSCLKGKCSECKVKVISGEYSTLSSQEGLTNCEIRNNYCLSCVCKPLSDLILEEVNYIEGIFPKSKTFPAKISELEFLSKEVVKLTLRIPPQNKLSFLAGQYVVLSNKNIKRSYSIASEPSASNLVFIIKNHRDGQFSNYLFKKAQVNDLLRIEGPKGTYVLQRNSVEKVVFLSTGTGIAPQLSIISHALKNNILSPNQIILIHGQRTAREHLYNLRETFKDIKVILSTSREYKVGFFKGYVQDALLAENIDLEHTQVYACGNPNMVSKAKEVLIKNGLKSSNFKSDSFIAS